MPIDGFMGKWKPATSGECLLEFLATRVSTLQLQSGVLDDALGDLPRARSFSHFFQGAVVLHSFARLMQAGKHFRSTSIDSPAEAATNIRRFATDRLNIDRASCPQFDQLAPLVLRAAENSSDQNAATKKYRDEIVREFSGTLFCYSCGNDLDHRIADREQPDYMDIEHVWPHSLGGDTVLDNLLPVCIPCNSKRQHLASWEWALVQAPVLGSLGKELLDSDQVGKREKIALHARAALTYAKSRGCTLKVAYKSIGHRLPLGGVRLIDADDTPDFFNLYAHDADRWNVSWGELL